jgi:hypothetical protein
MISCNLFESCLTLIFELWLNFSFQLLADFSKPWVLFIIRYFVRLFLAFFHLFFQGPKTSNYKIFLSIKRHPVCETRPRDVGFITELHYHIVSSLKFCTFIFCTSHFIFLYKLHILSKIIVDCFISIALLIIYIWLNSHSTSLPASSIHLSL